MARTHETQSRWQYWIAVQLLATIALLCGSAHALNPSRELTQYMQTAWSSESGLPQNSVHAVAQTPDGYLWLGTEEGLARFDGVHFRVFTRDNSPGLASDYILSLATSANGTIWIGTDSGLSIYQPRAGSATGGTFRTLCSRDGLFSDDILSLALARDGSLWAGTTKGLNRIVNGRVEKWGLSRNLPPVAITSLAMDSSGALWAGTTQGLYTLHHGRFTRMWVRSGLPGNYVTALAAAPDGSLWASVEGGGLAHISHGQIAVPAVHLPPHDVIALLADRNGALWMTFDAGGIGRLYQGGLQFYSVPQGLPSARCTHALFEDREGDLWIGFLDAGLAELRDGKFAVYGTPEGLSGNYIGNVLQDRDGSFWIGADSNGLNHLLTDGQVVQWNARRGLPNESVYALAQTNDGSIWVGYRRGALARIHDGRVSVYRDPHTKRSSINALFQDSQGNLWVGFFGQGLARFENGRFHPLILTGNITGIAQSQDGALWVATDGEGIERVLDGHSTFYNAATGLPSNHAMCVYADPDGSVWVGTASGGLSRIAGGRIESWTVRQHLPATIGSILDDHLGNLWLGSDDGIVRESKQELIDTAGQPNAQLHPVLYGTAAGLRSRETLYGSMPCATRSRDGRLWFATIRGLAVIDPAHISSDSVVPPVSIQRLTFDDHAEAIENELRLGPGHGNLQIDFTAPSFVAPELVLFRYRLLGFDSDWSVPDPRRSAWYTNLPPGQYTFEVQAGNSDGLWNRKGASFTFVIRPRLSETPFAWALYILLALLITWAIISLRVRRLTRREVELTRLVAERTAQLEEEKTALEAARRELQIQATHDSLTGLFNRGAMLEHLQREVARAGRDRTILGVLIADLDHFKEINDQFGHLAGDDIIRDAAERFRATMRGYDIVGRYGGEEFLILLPNFDLSRSPSRVEDLLNCIRSQPFVIAEKEIHVTCSIGVGTWQPSIDLPDLREIIGRADTALYVAKASGRNRASFEVRDGGSTVEFASYPPGSEAD